MTDAIALLLQLGFSELRRCENHLLEPQAEALLRSVNLGDRQAGWPDHKRRTGE
jgi:hypothetical protein